MSVPKCKECKFRELINDNSWSSLEKNFCFGFKTTDKEGYQTGIEKFIPASKMKTSPRWCPLRKDENYMNDLLNKYGRNK